jgi:hypothetical protein
MHWSLVPAWLSALGICAAQSASGLAPEVLTLAKIKVHMHEVLVRQPNYTCVEQIERSRRRAPKNKFELIDMVRLEVALVDGKELFAWPGSSKFEDADLSKMVPAGGAIGNGNFALFARAVFESSAPIFNYKGIVQLNGERAIKYDFRVAQLNSGYRIRVNDREAVVCYHGAFWADPVTHDVRRLEIWADDIPPSMELDQSVTAMDYNRVKIGQSAFLLPAASELSMTHPNGDMNRNYVRFSSCREYLGESVLTFGDAPLDQPAPVAAKPAKTVVEIPPDVSFDVVLDADVDSEHSMVGDPVTATLRQDIKHDRQVLFAKGARVIGRILRLERHDGHCIVDLQFSELDSGDSHSTLLARIEDTHLASTGLGFRGLVAEPIRKADLGAMSVKGSKIHLPRGLRLRLRTHTLPPESGQ